MNDKSSDGDAGHHEFHYFVDGVKYDSRKPAITGSEIKRLIPNFNPAFQVFLEKRGSDPDELVSDGQSYDLTHGAPHFYTVPPATFGAR